MFGTGIKTVEGRLFVSQRQPPICTYLCTYNFLEACSSRNHVSHSWRSNASIGFSCGKPIYMYYAAPFYRSASNQESSPFLCSPLVLLLLHLAPRQLSVSFFFFIRLFIQAFSLCLIFFFFIIYPLSPVSPFYLITYLFSTVDLFSSHRLYFRVRFLLSPPVTPSFSRSTPLFALLFFFFRLLPISILLLYLVVYLLLSLSFQGSKSEEALVLLFDILKISFDFIFLYASLRFFSLIISYFLFSPIFSFYFALVCFFVFLYSFFLFILLLKSLLLFNRSIFISLF